MWGNYENLGSVSIQLDITVERNDSDLVPWDIVEDESIIPDDYSDSWADDLGCIEADVWPLDDPANPKTAKCGDVFHIKGLAKIEFSKQWTDYGWEYDAQLTWEDMDIKQVKPRKD